MSSGRACTPARGRRRRSLNVDIAWRGPLREDDRDSQVSEVENAVARRVSGIALAPLDEVALVAPVESAQRSGVPVVIFDSGLKGGEIRQLRRHRQRQGRRARR